MVSDCGRIASEKHMAEDEAHYRACTECTCVCQTTHGKGLPRSVPKFSRSIPEYALPTRKDCNLQIPAPFVREHIANVSKREYILVGVTGSEWRVTFKDIALKDGWKAFAADYRLEKGDRVVFALIAPYRFYVDVFNRFGLEKNPVDLPRTAVKETPQLCLPNESPVSNFTSRADGRPQHTPTRELKPNVSAPSSGKASDQNINHDEKLIRLPYKRALTEKNYLSHEPVENPEVEPSSTSLSSIASDDSVQVRLAKAVLLKSKQKKLKKRKMSCTSSPQVEAVVETAKCDGTSGAEEPELCKYLQNEDKAMEVTSVEDRISKGVVILGSCVDPAGSSMGNDVETVFTKPCDDSIVGVSNDDELNPDVGHELQNLSNRVPDQPKEAVSQNVALLDQRQNDALDETETARGATGEDSVLEGSEIRQVEELQPGPVFQPALVKPEPDLDVAEPLPYQTCKKCINCGLFRKEASPIHTRNLKPEPVTLESPVTEDQKQQALTAAKVLSATLPNRHATVVMRVGFNEKTYDCFVSLNCSEMLPSEATQLILLDSECVTYKAHWNADRRYLQGPGWRDFVDSHNLQINDVFVMELLERSEKRCVVLTHIFHAHEMVNLPVSASPGITGNVQATPAGSKRRSSKLLQGCSPISTNKRAKALKIVEAVQMELPKPRAPSDNTEYYPEPSTPRSSRRTPGRARATDVTPSSTNQITRVSSPNVDAAVAGTQLIVGPLPVASTADTARADTESPGLSTTTRSRRMLSSHGNPATASLASVPISNTGDESSKALNREQAKLAIRAKQKAVRERAKLYSPHVRKKGVSKPSKATMQQRQRHRSTDESKKQVRTRTSQKVQYPVAKMLDRRKSVEGNVLFLVELGKLVSQSSIHKRMKAKQDGKGRWWVPHHHFTKDFTSCFIE